MIYSCPDYAREFHPNKNYRTVLRMLHSGLHPENHKLHFLNKYIVIEVLTDSSDDCYYIRAAEEFMKGKRTHERAAELAIKYDLSMIKLCKIIGL